MKIMLCSVCFTVIMMLMVTNLKIANAQNGPFWDNLMAKYWADSRVKQLILVEHIGGSDAKVKFYVKSQENPLSWSLLLSCNGFVGKNGIGKEKEGDLKTPTGEYDIFCAVGIKDNPGTKAKYIKLDEHIYCAEGPYYNRLVDDRDVPLKEIMKYDGDPMSDGSPQFDYGLFMAYNKERRLGKGSQIYLHCTGPNPYTMGCVAISEENMKFILQHVDNSVKICIYPL